MYVAEIVHAMNSGIVTTEMLAVFKLVKALISANMYGMRSTCVVRRFLKGKVAVRTQGRNFGIKSMYEHMFI